MENEECNGCSQQQVETKVHDPEVKNIVFGDGKGGEFLRISKIDGVVLNRAMYPDFTPDDFVSKFMEIIEKNLEVNFTRKVWE